MTKMLTLLLLFVPVLLVCGCIDSTTDLHVRNDGTGTVTETVLVTRTMQRVMEMMTGMAVALWEDAEGKKGAGTTVGRDHYEARAREMGEGVSLVSLEQVKGRNGASGMKAVYAFRDVRKIRLSVEPDYALPEAVTASSITNLESSVSSSQVTFEFRKLPRSELVAKLPWAEKTKPAVMARTGMRSDVRMSAEEAGMLRHVLDGFRARMLISFDGPVVETDAEYVEVNRNEPDKKQIILYDLRIGEAVRNEARMDQMASIGPVPDLTTALVSYAGVPGMKIAKTEKVKVVF